MAAIIAAHAGGDVTLYEKEDRFGKKILASGNGRCNISNTRLHVNDYFGTQSDFVTHALKNFDFHHFKKFCTGIGLHLNIHNDGRVYPLSNEAKSVQSLLIHEAFALHVKLLHSHNVTAIDKRGAHFYISANGVESEAFTSVLIATGSEAAKQLGATADGYAFAQHFNHEILPPYPALVGLHLNSPLLKRLSGIKLYGELSLFINREKVQQISGDILFTKYGISGFATLDISLMASAALLQGAQVSVAINILPQIPLQELGSRLAKMASQLPHHSVQMLLEGMISTKIAPLLLKECAIDPELTCKTLSTKAIKKILHQMTQWRFSVIDTHGFGHAEVSGGGVSTQHIDARTMESKRVKGLYFSGEVLDIVGKRGGYNLHFAWASGYLAAQAMLKTQS